MQFQVKLYIQTNQGVPRLIYMLGETILRIGGILKTEVFSFM